MKKKTKKEPRIINIKGCNFTGIKWDRDSLEAVLTVAKGLTNLTELFKSQNIQIDTLLSVNPELKNDNR